MKYLVAFISVIFFVSFARADLVCGKVNSFGRTLHPELGSVIVVEFYYNSGAGEAFKNQDRKYYIPTRFVKVASCSTEMLDLLAHAQKQKSDICVENQESAERACDKFTVLVK